MVEQIEGIGHDRHALGHGPGEVHCSGLERRPSHAVIVRRRVARGDDLGGRTARTSTGVVAGRLLVIAERRRDDLEGPPLLLAGGQGEEAAP